MTVLWHVFWQFLILGCVSFGGPAAHIGYFQTTFVSKLRWLNVEEYARLVSLSQFLPGPGSSQIGFAIGIKKAGILGGIAAFIGFTTPSFLIMYFLATASSSFAESTLLNGIVHGLKLLAVVVVADAVVTMFKSFCQQRLTIVIAVITGIILLLIPSVITQVLVLVVAASVGAFCGQDSKLKALDSDSGGVKWTALVLFFLLLALLPLLLSNHAVMALFSDFFQAGSLVFGGGHVVLPLLQQIIAESITNDSFLFGYAAAQAVPGPMFSLAAFLGAELLIDTPLLGASIATLAIFLPGLLLVVAFQDAWHLMAQRKRFAGAIWGVNAAVVGLLMSVLYQPVFISAVFSAIDMALVVAGFFLLRLAKLPILLVVVSFAGIGAIFF